MVQIHQGDVILILIKTIPSEAKLISEEVVQRGELTGHAHWIPQAKIYADSKKKKFVSVCVDNKMYHGVEKTREIGGDHPSISVPEGNYEVRVQKEYFPDGKKEVMD